MTISATRKAPVDHPILDVIASRWSPRAIDANRPVEHSLLLRVLEAARWAPSSGNGQPWGFVVFDDTVPGARDEARGILSRGNAWAHRAPVLLLATAATSWEDGGDERPTARYDAGAASMALSLQATHEGLVVHQMAGFDRSAARNAFGLPDHVEPQAMIALGWPGDIALLDKGRQERERAPRTRRTVNEITMRGAWSGTGV